MDDAGRKLEEVAKTAGVSPRTVRYYIQRGLLPPPRVRGPDTAYGPEHLVRLRAIRRLQEAFWPLDAIGGLLAGRTDEELEPIANGGDVPAPRGAAAEPAVAPKRGADRAGPGTGRTVRRFELTNELVLEAAEPASDETASLLAAIRALVAKRRGA